MSMTRRVAMDGFNSLCGNLIGSGAYRNVFVMRFDTGKVVKVERNQSSRWCNVLEWTLWQYWKDCPDVAKWLAPCHHLSDGGHILIMDRTTPALALPKTLPQFLTDTKSENFGIIGKQLVCHDYAFTISNMSTRQRRVNWRIEDAYTK